MKNKHYYIKPILCSVCLLMVGKFLVDFASCLSVNSFFFMMLFWWCGWLILTKLN